MRDPPKLARRWSTQYEERAATQLAHEPHATYDMHTESPTFTDCTSSPTRSTTPAPSWPSTAGCTGG